jgi:cadmium resistance protein CadD (predicted permease)
MPIMTGGHDHDLGSMYMSFHDYSRRRSQNLLIGGLITLFVGIALAVFLSQVADGQDEKMVWLVGMIPASVGLALLIGSQIVKPRNGDSSSTTPPRS